MTEKQKIRSLVENLNNYYNKGWTEFQKEEFAEILNKEYSSSQIVRKAIERIKRKDKEMATNPIPVFDDRVKFDEKEVKE